MARLPNSIGATTPKHVATEMALHILAYNMKRVIAIIGMQELLKAIAALSLWFSAIVMANQRVRSQQSPCKATQTENTKAQPGTAVPKQTD